MKRKKESTFKEALMINSFEELFSHLKEKGRENIVVAGGEDIEAVKAVRKSYDYGFGRGILVGDREKIEDVLSQFSDKNFVEDVVHAVTDEEKSSFAVQRVQKGGVLLKGQVKTSKLLKEVLDKENGLRTGSIISDVFVFEDQREEGQKLVLMSDGGVNIKPDIKTLISIVKNAVRLAHKLGKENPLVAMLAAVEVVNPDMEETIAAALISQMNKRGQIKDCTIDGPLALDNAISQYAAKKKGIKSAVAGIADILIVPNIVAGNIFGKALTYYANFKNGHIIVGTKVPVMIPSRADTSDVKFNSIALAIVRKNK